MASPPASTKTSLGQKLRARARDRWPQLTGVTVRFRGKFAYVTGQLPDGQELPLCRLRYAGYASLWGFAIYRASHDDYQDSILPSGQFAGTPEEALDWACGLYLADPSAWLPPPTDTPMNGGVAAGQQRVRGNRCAAQIGAVCCGGRRVTCRSRRHRGRRASRETPPSACCTPGDPVSEVPSSPGRPPWNDAG